MAYRKNRRSLCSAHLYHQGILHLLTHRCIRGEFSTIFGTVKHRGRHLCYCGKKFTEDERYDNG